MAHSKSNLPSKLCLVCQRPFTWRKKWQRNWEQVKYCSKRCQSNSRSRGRPNISSDKALLSKNKDNDE